MRTIAPILAILILESCAPGIHEMHRIDAIEMPEYLLVKATDGAGEEATTKTARTCEKHPCDLGRWYVRRVEAPRGDSRELSAVEIIWCNTASSNYNS
jgi:hypothetical protein